MPYNWQLPDWPDFRYELAPLEADLLRFQLAAGRIAGAWGALEASDRNEAIVAALSDEAIESSRIEGEHLDPRAVQSSIQRRLGIPTAAHPVDLRSSGAAELILAAREALATPLSESMLLQWHRTLMQGRSGHVIGEFRTHAEPMQIVSGSDSVQPRIHFEAPASADVPSQMRRFLDWFNASGPAGSETIVAAPVRAAVVHLYFESIHPFEDGNGRIGRALAERALFQTIGLALPISISRAIEASKRAYYDAIALAQRSNEISAWVHYFVQVLLQAEETAERTIEYVLRKTRYLQRQAAHWNERQHKAVLRMLEAGPGGFTGGMTAKKYMAITGSSKATATRDLVELAKSGALVAIGSGRGARYELNLGD